MKKENISTVDMIYSHVFNKIQSRAYEAGDRINIEELSRELGVSRTPIREALNKLIQDGFAEQKYNAGVRVVQHNQETVFDIIEANTMLFNLVFDGFMEYGLPGEMLEELREIVDAQSRADTLGDYEKFHRMAVEFHFCLISYCWNNTIKGCINTTQKQINLSAAIYQLEQENRQRSLVEHRLILKQLAAGRIDLAKKSMEKHNQVPVEFLRDHEE